MEPFSPLQSLLDPYKPSLFDLLSSTHLNSLLAPTLRYILTNLTYSSPRLLLPIYNRFDELYSLLSLLIEHRYLSTYNSTFVEHFYNLKRERALSIPLTRADVYAAPQTREIKKLSRRDIYANLLGVVGLEYLKRKVDQGYERYIAHENLISAPDEKAWKESQWREKVLRVYKVFLRRVWPWWNLGIEGLTILFRLAYAFDGTGYASFWLWIIGTKIMRMKDVDFRANELHDREFLGGKGVRPGEVRGIFSSPRLFLAVLQKMTANGLKFVLPMSIFALKFLEWWYASDFARQLGKKASEGLDIPPPTIDSTFSNDVVGTKNDLEKVDAKEAEKRIVISASTRLQILTVPKPSDTSLCPICLDSIKTATATSTGYIYCYSCVHPWIEGTHSKQEALLTKKKKWDIGKGRDPISGLKLLGGSSCLRRIMI